MAYSSSALSSQGKDGSSSIALFSFVTAAEGYINSGNMKEAGRYIQLYKEANKNALTPQQRKEFQERIERVNNTLAIYQRSLEAPKRKEVQNINRAHVDDSFFSFHTLANLASNASQAIGKTNLTALGIIGASFFYSVPIGIGLGALGIGYKIYSLCGNVRSTIRNENLTNHRLFPQKTIKVNLINARQYDRAERPAACSFHAISAMDFISGHFDETARAIVQNNADHLSIMQNGIIDRGLQMYKEQSALRKELIRGADFEQITVPVSLKFRRKKENIIAINNSRDNVDELTAPIIEHLFSPSLSGKKIAWVKNINDESFALISNNSHMIVFDSHRNEINLVDKNSAQEFLKRKILQEHFGKQDYNYNAFEFALGES